jgi:hypothetical protein
MKSLAKVLLLVTVVLFLAPGLVLADPNDTDATCSVTVTVDNIMEWSGNFSGIDLGTITSQGDIVDGNDTTTLYTNGNVDITADNTATAQLSNGDPNSSDTLVTEYKLTYDGDGASATGGSTVDWTEYDTFLSSASVVTHISEDGAVEVRLWARASNPAGEVADAGSYGATQTLTASWGTQ